MKQIPDRCGEYKYNDDQLYVSTWVMSLMRAGVDPLGGRCQDLLLGVRDKLVSPLISFSYQ